MDAEHVFTVSELTSEIRHLLSATFGTVQVEGEVSRFKPHSSGHWYFTLTDGRAALNCVMFRGDNRRVGWRPAEGERVRVSGQLDVYAKHGSYSLVVRAIRRAGQGDLAERIAALKRKLQAEGLTDPARKRPLPEVPAAIGVATSPTGAAIRDILRVLGQRFPSVTVYLAPCRVQGEEAPREIVEALRLLADHGRSEVVIVARGGGSAEDLMAFNDEAVARAIAALPVPVVTGIGHEVDDSVADVVADVRAATPSQAAELVVPRRDELLLRVDELADRLERAVRRRIERHRERLGAVRLRDPRQRLVDARVRLRELGERLRLAVRRALVLRRERLGAVRLRDPRQRLVEARARVREARERLDRAARTDLARRRQLVEARAGRLRALSPLAVLSRGYAIALRRGRAVRSADELRRGDALVLRLHRGQADITVDAVRRGLFDLADDGDGG